jgi:hypothetical protein
MNFAEQIAVLDGLALGALRPGYNDGRTGANRAAVDQYGRAVASGVLRRRNVVDASEGGNYSGGSSYAPGLPLLPSTIGLADMPLPGVLPERTHVIDPSSGGNYGGGSSYAPGLPLLPSTVGLAACAGCSAGSAVDQDLAGAFNALSAVRGGYNDGRTGANRAAIDQYAKGAARGVLRRKDVLDASEGGNYSGGSSYAPGLPLLPSTVGLAGLAEHDPFDGLELSPIMRALKRAGPGSNAWLRRVLSASAGAVSKERVVELKSRARNLAKKLRDVKYNQPAKQEVLSQLRGLSGQLAALRAVRRAVATLSVRDGVPVAVSSTFSPTELSQLQAARRAVAKVMIRDGVPVRTSMKFSPTTY